jgi:sulfur-oxidizing protein SoxY
MSKTISAQREHSLNRRDALRLLGFGTVAAAGGVLASTPAAATPDSAAAHMQKISGTSNYKTGKISLKLPEIAENGATVPLTVTVDSPMSSGSYVKTIHVAADANPNPEVVTFNLSPAMGKAQVSTRLRLAKTQNVIAVAVMNDGSVYKSAKQVKVTIGGCGG